MTRRGGTALVPRSNGVVQLGLFTLTATGLEVKGNPTFAEWEHCGEVLRKIEGAIQFAIGDWLNYGEPHYGEKYAQAIDVNQADTWRNYAWVANAVEMSIRIDNLSWSHHLQVAPFEPDEQRELLARAIVMTDKGPKVRPVSEFKAIIRLFKHDQKVAAIQSGAAASGVYDIVCADPPWAYDNSGFEQSAAAHYPTLDVEAICTLPDTADDFPAFADSSVLFLWATSPLLPDAIRVLEAWGFSYKASFVWLKDRAPGLGWWVKTRHELLLIGVRGDAPVPIVKVDSVITESVGPHSRKPAGAYTAIDAMYPPGLRRVEIFAREPRDGWDRWGNEA